MNNERKRLGMYAAAVRCGARRGEATTTIRAWKWVGRYATLLDTYSVLGTRSICHCKLYEASIAIAIAGK